MVRTNNSLNKSAFTMIELIFAIVIIAITVISLPMMTQVTSKGMENSFAQEAIFLASAELNQALSYKWDRNSTENIGELSKVMFAPTNTTCNATTRLRPGHVHRMCLNTSTAATLTAGVDTINQSDFSINNAATTSDINISTTGTGSASGYKENYTMDIDVSFVAFDTITLAEQNIKEVLITVKKAGNDYVVLRTYSANIGEVESAKRTF